MVTVDNFTSKLRSFVLDCKNGDNIRDWRLIGQEQNGSLLFSWTSEKRNEERKTQIGCYEDSQNKLEILYSFNNVTNCIQASVDHTKSYLALVVKDSQNEDREQKYLYKPFLVALETQTLCHLQLDRSKQIMVQFLYMKQSVLSETLPVKFLILIHQECILQYQIKTNEKELTPDSFTYDSFVRAFIWAQWDPVHQTLYYIHNKKPTRSLVEGEDPPSAIGTRLSSTLSGLQFHDDLPHESVLNIPLNLPHISTVNNICGLYEDDAVPLRIHDCSLDLLVVTNGNGFICICHHYLYQPIQPPVDAIQDEYTLVHFAYSVTVLHQSCVLHCVVPGLPFSKAKTIRPLFKIDGNHMVVFIPEICTHLLDIGIMHEPCCHLTLKPFLCGIESHQLCFVPLVTLENNYVVNLTNLDLVDLKITNAVLIEEFKSNTSLENMISILHYLILHQGEIQLALELICWQAEQPLNLKWAQLLREYLIASSYASVQRNLPPDAGDLLNLLPITTQHIGSDLEVKMNNKTICLSHDVLWNTSMMLLSPQQRIVPYRSDIWVRLWEQLAVVSKGKQRFRPAQVVDKLMVSLVCYQPEALSRSSTPMSPSPGSSLSSSTVLHDLYGIQGSRKGQLDDLPFYETESCTASRQEHIISVNLRELSMHLLKQSTENKITIRFQWQYQSPMHVHAIATRYVSAQLEQSRKLCQALCNTVTTPEPMYCLEKGFLYIEHLNENSRYLLFTVLERYYLAIESIAFPQPQGFTSFFTFLGYKTLDSNMFLQYVQRNVFELQVDVMKAIMSDIPNTKDGIKFKLKLLSLLPRSRATRLLNQWQHPISLMLRAREHSLNILSGVEGATGRLQGSFNKSYSISLDALPSGDRYSPLDSFLDLLTAKASLTDLDFGLLIEATESSTVDFL